MNEKENTPSVLDSLIQSRQLQMLKTVVPYMDEPRQRTISFLIRMIELQKTMRLFDAEPQLQAQELHICSDDPPTERACRMLNALREFCTPGEQETIDLFVNVLDTFASCETMLNN